MNIYINIIKKMITNQVEVELLKNFLKLAIDLDKQINQVLEESRRNILINHEITNKKNAEYSPVLPY